MHKSLANSGKPKQTKNSIIEKADNRTETHF